MEAMTAAFSSFVREEFVAEGKGHPLPEAQLNELNGKTQQDN